MRKPPEDPAKKILRLLDKDLKSAEVIPIATAIEHRKAPERTAAEEIETLPKAEVRKRLIQAGSDPDQIERDGRQLMERIRGSAVDKPKPL